MKSTSPTCSARSVPAGQAGQAGGASIFEDIMGRVRGGRAPRQRAGRTAGSPPDDSLLDRRHAAARRRSTFNAPAASTRAWSSRSHQGSIPEPSSGLKGQGEPGTKGTPAGDLTITVHVEPHPYFKREGRNLLVEVPITVSEAILGAKIDVPALDGMKSLTIPPGSSSGLKLRLKGQGIPASGGKPDGDLFVVLKIVVPKTIDAASRRLIEEFAERNPYNPRAGLW